MPTSSPPDARSAGTAGPGTEADAGTASGPRAVGSIWVYVALVAAFAVPFAVAIGVLAEPRWFPLLDHAQTEMRVRDVGTGEPPLVGLPGRIGTLDRQGSHPGPLSFWALAPGYRAFGGSAWALQATTAALNLLAVALALWIARRRGGTTLMLGLGLALGVLVAFYGPSLLTEAWNPYLPMMWFLPFLLAVWSVLCDDFALMPVVAFTGSFCVQTHISYVGLVCGLLALAAVWLAVDLYRRRAERDRLRRAGRWALAGLGVLVLVWIPPVYQQLTESPGNLGMIWEHFTDPPETSIGAARGLELLLVHLNPWRLVAGQDGTTGSVVPGAFVLAAWAAAFVVAWRLRARGLLVLQMVIAVELVLGLASMGNIFGYVWYYLMLWAWGLQALMILAIGWTVVALLRARGRFTSRAASVRLDAVLVTGTVAALMAFGVAAATVEPPSARVSAQLGVLVRQTVRALDRGTIPGTGPDGRYMVTFTDTANIGGPAYGLLLELEREGFDVGFPGRETIVPNRFVGPDDATAVVHLAVGSANIARWRAKPDMHEVAYVDIRTPAERAEYARLRAEAMRLLEEAGLEDQARRVDENLFTAIYTTGTPPRAKRLLERMLEIGQPAAIFVGPPLVDEADN
ncbi:MAG: hypothetical protein FJW88_06115 [Actinobacteria bacterium]|nr:hypothetical protein [Actinomycetota bacterium]